MVTGYSSLTRGSPPLRFCSRRSSSFVSSGDPRRKTSTVRPPKGGPVPATQWGGGSLFGRQFVAQSAPRAHDVQADVQIYIPDAMVAPRHAILFAAKKRFFLSSSTRTTGPRGQPLEPLQLATRTCYRQPRDSQRRRDRRRSNAASLHNERKQACTSPPRKGGCDETPRHGAVAESSRPLRHGRRSRVEVLAQAADARLRQRQTCFLASGQRVDAQGNALPLTKILRSRCHRMGRSCRWSVAPGGGHGDHDLGAHSQTRRITLVLFDTSAA